MAIQLKNLAKIYLEIYNLNFVVHNSTTDF